MLKFHRILRNLSAVSFHIYRARVTHDDWAPEIMEMAGSQHESMAMAWGGVRMISLRTGCEYTQTKTMVKLPNLRTQATILGVAERDTSAVFDYSPSLIQSEDGKRATSICEALDLVRPTAR